MGARVDALIITAAEGEDDGVLAVDEGRLGAWQKGERFGYPVWFAEFESSQGGVLRVALARPVDLGGEHTAAAASPLVHELKPQCLAMCGVCGGRPGWANLGDVVIASKTWRYDTGELVRRVSGAEPDINQAVTTYQIAAPWLPKAQAAAKAWSNPAGGQWPSAAAWLASRPLDYELQGLWLLRELAEGRDPLAAPDREQRCPNWGAVVDQLQERGWLLRAAITDAGREHVRGALFRGGGKLPEPSGWRVHVGPLATGNRLVRDVDIWATLAKTERLVLGLDMEASALAQVGWVHNVDHALVVKGVMDYAEPERHRGFRPFAARAAAEVLLRFLRETLPPLRGDLRQEGHHSGGAVLSPAKGPPAPREGLPTTGEGRPATGTTGEVPPATRTTGEGFPATGTTGGEPSLGEGTRGLVAPPPGAIDVFFSYSHKDEALRDELEAHLAALKRTGVIRGWHDRRIAPGATWKGEIDKNLDAAALVLLLVSADFLASDYCFDVEMGRALERQRQGKTHLVPVILRACDWTTVPSLGKLQALPRDAKPVTSWGNRDEAWSHVAQGIRAVATMLRQARG
jgi:nucleoside phosphorylase